jgi:hypothetical protein
VNALAIAIDSSILEDLTLNGNDKVLSGIVEALNFYEHNSNSSTPFVNRYIKSDYNGYYSSRFLNVQAVVQKKGGLAFPLIKFLAERGNTAAKDMMPGFLRIWNQFSVDCLVD